MSKTVVVTGAGSGIGRAIASTLAQREWRVVVTDVNAEAAAEVAAALPNPDVGHESAQLDVTSADSAAAVAADVAGRLGLDAWVSNAGISFMHRFLDAPGGWRDRAERAEGSERGSVDRNGGGSTCDGQSTVERRASENASGIAGQRHEQTARQILGAWHMAARCAVYRQWNGSGMV